MENITQLSINTLRMLSVEQVEKANSGHPGLPLGCAPIVYTVFSEFLKFNPENPKFQNRDRFVLSAGHGSSLNYSLLHLFGYDVSTEDLKNFRQFGSKTAGHPEVNNTPGIETTTGPLGQGVANAVGMAIAETFLAKKFNRENFPICDHYTYALTGDGCMMEGIEYEAASLAGTLKLGKLIVLYDNNDITIEGKINTAFSEDVGARHKAQGWQVLRVEDGNDTEALKRAIKLAKKEKDKPTLIICKTIIGYGSPLADSANCHGSPLGSKNVEILKKNLNWNYAPFEVPEEVSIHMQKIIARKKREESKWKKLLKAYKVEYPELFNEYNTFMSGKLPDLLNNEDLWKFDKADATRSTSSTVLNKLAKLIPNLMGGSADLGPSNKSVMNGFEYYSPENRDGRNIHFGIREHAMSAICNGMALHGGVRPYCSTFFIFTDYMKNAMRLSALMGLNIPYILTHDSIGVGEDGPTHEPIEQLIALRSIPNMKVFRPADGKETTSAWISALTGKEPTCLVLSRQNLPQYENSGKEALKGGYILIDSEKKTPDIILMASGSEVELIVKAKAVLKEKGIDARIVSMPCFELFEAQSDSYKEKILPKKVRARLAVEAGSPYSWYKYTGIDGDIIGMSTFGASAPAPVLFNYFGFSVENVVNKAMNLVK